MPDLFEIQMRACDRQNAPQVELPLEFETEFVSRFLGGARYIGKCKVTFDTEGFSVEGKRLLRSFVRYFGFAFAQMIRLAVPFVPTLSIRKRDTDYVSYSDILKIKRHSRYYYFYAFNSKGTRHWYCMKVPDHLTELITEIDVRYFPREEGWNG